MDISLNIISHCHFLPHTQFPRAHPGRNRYPGSFPHEFITLVQLPCVRCHHVLSDCMRCAPQLLASTAGQRRSGRAASLGARSRTQEPRAPAAPLVFAPGALEASDRGPRSSLPRTSRGTKTWPVDGACDTDTLQHARCRPCAHRPHGTREDAPTTTPYFTSTVSHCITPALTWLG